MNKKKSAFSLIEIIVVIVIIGIMATFGIPYYQNVIEDANEKVCNTNLETLTKGVEMYLREHDTAPGSLSELKQEDLDKAYAQVMQGKGAWKKRLAYFIAQGPGWGLAYAQGYGFPRLRCPNNPDHSANAISYGLNACIANMSYQMYMSLNSGTVIVADSDTAVFAYPATNTAGCSTADTGYNATIRARGHKNFNVLAPPERYLKGGTKGGKTAAILSTHIVEDKPGKRYGQLAYAEKAAAKEQQKSSKSIFDRKALNY